jgi:hypothetical protein
MITLNNKFLVFFYGNVHSTDKINIYSCQYHLINYADREEIVLKTLDVNKTCGYDNKVINSFDKSTLKWKKKLENYEKFQNYHGCKVFISSAINSDFVSCDFLSLPYEVSKMVGRRINFTVATCEENNKYYEKIRYQMNEKTPYDKIMNDFYEINLFYDEIEKLFDNHLSSYDFTKLTFMITPGESYSNFEKLYLPFDNETWKYLIITFGLTFSIIFIINHLSSEVQVFLSIFHFCKFILYILLESHLWLKCAHSCI